MKTKVNTQSAEKKLRWSNQLKEWVGYLTPSEYMALIEKGATPMREEDVTRAQERLEEGKSNGQWMYFRHIKWMHHMRRERSDD